MNPILRKNVIATLIGILIGGFVNMAIITLGPMIIPPPEGADLTTTEGILAAMPSMESKHFIVPIIAHALGTLVGAFIAAKYAASNHLKLALLVGVVFLLGGAYMAYLLPAPSWVEITDLAIAYLPMGWLGWKLAGGKQPNFA